MLVTVAALAALVAAGLYVWAFDRFSAVATDSVRTKPGDLLVSLGTVALSGGVVALLLELFKRSQARSEERVEQEIDFLRRMRAAYVALASARTTARVEDTVDAYVTGFRDIALVVSTLEDLENDLIHASDAFPKSRDSIICAVHKLTGLTRALVSDYSKSLGTIRCAGPDAGVRSRLQSAATDTPERRVSAFLDPPDCLPEGFRAAVDASKGVMREHVYGPADRPRDDCPTTP
jgi:hypothetical protein